MRLIKYATALSVFTIVMVFVVYFCSAEVRFRHHSEKYYIQFTKACDLLLAHHSIGTSRDVELSLNINSLPKIIQDLQPSTVTVAPNRVWIHSSGGKFGIEWEPEDKIRTNIWFLRTGSEGRIRTVYVGVRGL